MLQRTRPWRCSCNRGVPRVGSLSFSRYAHQPTMLALARRHLFVVAAIGLAVLSGGCSAARPLHRSPASIRDALLKRTPAGTPHEDVVAFVKREGWSFLTSTRTGVPMQQVRPGPMRPLVDYPGSAGSMPQQEVKAYLNVSLGSYWKWPIFERHVQSFWLFGADNLLLDIWVWKYSDTF